MILNGFLWLAHIGPVQSFIASGRRTRDLYYGSGLLSEISKVVAATIVEQYSIASLIFPATINENDLKLGSNLDVANKILAAIPADLQADRDTHKQQLNALGKKITDKIEEYLTDRQEDLQKSIEGAKKGLMASDDKRGEVDWDIVKRQFNELIEYYWVAVPFQEQSYATARMKVEAVMAARKNTRIFQQPTTSSEQQKSSITGELESVLSGDLYPKKRNFQREAFTQIEEEGIRQQARVLEQLFRAGPNEHLSGVDLLKRRGTFAIDPTNGSGNNRNDRLNFPSTSHMAALPYLACLRKLPEDVQKSLKDNWKSYIDTTSKLGYASAQAIEYISAKAFSEDLVLGRYDGGMLYAERLSQDTDYTANLPAAQNALKAFFKQVNEKFEYKIEPPTYYAILVADGDSMGKVINFQAKMNGIEQHRKLTRALASFAQEARKIVQEENQGVAIYTGGDDVMAFLPIHRAIPCGQALASSFQKHMSPFEDEKHKTATLSAGIAIVHHLELLREALEIARSAEKRAKGVEEKNAVAITIAKRGGEHYSVAGHWNDLDLYLLQLVQYYAARSIPKSLAYDVRETVLRLQGLDSSIKQEKEKEPEDPTQQQQPSLTAEKVQAIIRADIQRILLRRLTDPRQVFPPANPPNEHKPKQPPPSENAKEQPPTEAYRVTNLYELLQARICLSETQFQEIEAYTSKQKKQASETDKSMWVKAIYDKKGRIDFTEFTNELLVAQTLAETQILLNTMLKTKQKDALA